MTSTNRFAAALHRSHAALSGVVPPRRVPPSTARIHLLWLLLAGSLAMPSPGTARAQQPTGPKVATGRLNLCDRVAARRPYPGMLRASDVCMRSLRPRPINSSDPHDTLRAIRDFHVTRLEWTYGLTAEFISKVRTLGCTASGACANANLFGISRSGDEWYKQYSILDLDGRAVEAPWMRAWTGHAMWHCVNNPAARNAYLNYVKDQVDQGVRDLQRDDPTMNYHATRWGACFCKHCVEGFRKYLEQHAAKDVLQRYDIQDLRTFDYAEYLRARGAPAGDAFAKYPEDDLKRQGRNQIENTPTNGPLPLGARERRAHSAQKSHSMTLKRLFIAFQEQSTIEFHRWWRKELNDHAGRPVPVSSNNGAADFGPIHSLFDCYIGELSYARAQPETLYDIARQVQRLGKGQTVTMPLRRDSEETRQWIDTTRRTIATVYALGMHIEAPWDTYLPVHGAVNPPRYFGKPEDYSDLFAMVRAETALLDGYETAAVNGGMIDEHSWTAETTPVTVFSKSTRVFAFTRALPGRAEAPIVVHLVDWSGDDQPFTVSLNPDVFFAGRPLRISLITPKPYDRQAHIKAFDSGDYRPLVEEVLLAAGYVTTVQVPPLRPWGMLVVRPQPEKAGLWPPRFIVMDDQGIPAVRLLSPHQSATVRFTTDGSDPDQNSPTYRQPVSVESCHEIRACSYQDGLISAVSILRHFPAVGQRAKPLLVNGDFSQGKKSWHRVISPATGDRDALEFTVEKIQALDNRLGARLHVKTSDGVPYHLRLVQPVSIPAGARLYVTATLLADRATRVRFGIQERRAPYRGVHVGVFDIGPQPRRLRLNMTNPFPDLEAQVQLDLGYCKSNTTVWISDVAVRVIVK